MFYKNYDQLKPNDQMYIAYQVSGVLLIVLGIMFIIPVYHQIIPQERQAVEIVQDSDYLSLEYPTSNNSHFGLVKYRTEKHLLTSGEVLRVESLIKDNKIGLSLQTPLTSSPYLKEHYPYHPFGYLELNLSNQDRFIFYSKDKAYYVTNDHDNFPLRGDFSDLYDYLISLREGNTN
jgi:hypothetical protein